MEHSPINLFDKVPREVQLYIFSFLTRNDLQRVSCVCSSWKDLSHNDYLSNIWEVESVVAPEELEEELTSSIPNTKRTRTNSVGLGVWLITFLFCYLPIVIAGLTVAGLYIDDCTRLAVWCIIFSIHILLNSTFALPHLLSQKVETIRVVVALFLVSSIFQLIWTIYGTLVFYTAECGTESVALRRISLAFLFFGYVGVCTNCSRISAITRRSG